MRDQEILDSLIVAIQEGVIEDRPWSGFVPLLRQALHATYTNLIFRRIETMPADSVEISSGDVPSWVANRYVSDFGDRDPIPYFRMEPGRIYSYEELEGVCDLADDQFRRNFLLPAGFAHFLIFRITEPAGCNIWITATRQATQAPFSDAERALCGRLACHLSPALACRSALLRANFEKSEYQRAAEMLSFGVIALDGRGRIIKIDGTAERSLAHTSDLFVSGSRLRACFDDERLQQSMRASLETQRTQSCHIVGNPGFDLLVVPVEPAPDSDAAAPRLLIYISGGERTSRDASPHIAAAFDLSHTQARLAMELVNGLSLADAAKVIGITEQTARTYSKAIYHRTGTSRQGDLIQRILKSVLVLG